jgi:hypothetical protein
LRLMGQVARADGLRRELVAPSFTRSSCTYAPRIL